MVKRIDTLIIGSGPSVYGFVLGASKRALGNSTIITSDRVLPEYKNCKLHPKLTIGNVNIAERCASGALCSHVIGGFSNAWGGVLTPLNLKSLRNAFANRNVKKLHKSYIEVLSSLSKKFKLYSFDGYNKEIVSSHEMHEKFGLTKSYLLAPKSSGSWSTFGLSLEFALREMCLEKNIKILVGRATIISRLTSSHEKKCKFQVTLDDGSKFQCQRIILGAGFAGNVNLMSSLVSGLEVSSFIDHTPMLCLGFGVLKNNILSTEGSPIDFIARNTQQSVSFYKLSDIPLETLRDTSAFGTVLYKIPKFIKDKMFVTQSWSKYSNSKGSEGKGLSAFDRLSELFGMFGVASKYFFFFPIVKRTTKFSQGFHYMCPRFSSFDKEHEEIKKYIEALEKNGELQILGSLRIEKPFFEHPSLTLMAHSHANAELFLNKSSITSDNQLDH